jgi:hypothetical protein
MISVSNYWRLALVILPSVVGAVPAAIALILYIDAEWPLRGVSREAWLASLKSLVGLIFFAPAYVVWIALFLVITFPLRPRHMQLVVWLVPPAFFLSSGACLWGLAAASGVDIAFGHLLPELLVLSAGGYLLLLGGFGIKWICQRVGIVRKGEGHVEVTKFAA